MNTSRRIQIVITVLFGSWSVMTGLGGANEAEQILRAANVTGGLVVHIGCREGELTAALGASGRYIVQGLDTDPVLVRHARDLIRAQEAYGRVTIRQFDGVQLPFADNLVNVIVAEDLGDVSMDEVLRALAPLGVACLKQDGTWTTRRKPWPADIDEWTHYLHGPDNNAVAHDRIAAAPRSIQWVARPMWGRSHEELASMSAAVSAKGRLFFIVDEAPLSTVRFTGRWAIVARDAFNGALLWKREIPQWVDHLRHFRSGPVHLNRRLVAVGDEVYLTLGLGSPVTALDAATGKVLRLYEDSEYTEEILVDGDNLYLVAGSSEVDRIGSGLFRRGEPIPMDSRSIMAFDKNSGVRLWKKTFGDDEFLLPVTLAAEGSNVLYQSTSGIACLDAETGEQRWQTSRETPNKRMGFSAPTLVVTDEVVLCADRDLDQSTTPAGGRLKWGVGGWNEAGFTRKGKSTLRAYALDTGKELWSTRCSEGYNSPVDVFVLGSTVWVGSDYARYDLKTGEAADPITWKVGNVAMGHHRCYRNKATERFIFTGRSGIELVHVDKGWVGNNSWIRGACQYGIMPCNGLVYAPPDACACVPKVKQPGFFAAAPLRTKGGFSFPAEPTLELGSDQRNALPPDSDQELRQSWPMYRHDPMRSGFVSTDIPVAPKELWSVEIGGNLTQPVVVGDRTLVASTDSHTIHALRSDDGSHVWKHTVAGRIDSSPTIYRGMVLFGSADGWVYALRVRDGELVWRFRAAPEERQVVAFGQLESTWPVHGSLLVQNDTLYVTAGRSTYLDGGIILYRLDPITGEQLSYNVVTHIDPETDRQTGAEDKKLYGSDMEGSTTDILSGDGESVFLKHLHFDRQGNEQEKDKPHLFSITGFLIQDWYVRTYWLVGTDVQGGWGGWARAAGSAPSGRILCVDGDRVLGYGRKAVTGGRTGHRANDYQLFCEKMPRPSEEPQATHPDSPVAKKNRRTGRRPAENRIVWSDDQSLIVRAMVLAADKLVVAGPPDLGQRHESQLSFLNEAEALASRKGEKGVRLQIRAKADGDLLSECDLNAMPVLDGMAAAYGRLFLALENGSVVCLGQQLNTADRGG